MEIFGLYLYLMKLQSTFFYIDNAKELQVSLPKYNKTWYNSYYVLTPWLSIHDQVRILNELEYLFEKIDEIPCEKLPFWIVCIVKNEAVTILRKNQRTVRLENWDSFAADAESVTDYLELVQLFSRLPETYRAVLEMRLLLGYTGKEIARHLALSESAVNTRIFRGRALLWEIAEKEAFYA